MSKAPVTARNKLMDYLARRDHSEKELWQKLSKSFADEEIQKAIDFARESNWLIDPTELSEKVTQRLHEKRKGHLYIQKYLAEKGLPSTPREYGVELSKAEELLEKLPETATREKMIRYLNNRGFEPTTIREVINDLKRPEN